MAGSDSAAAATPATKFDMSGIFDSLVQELDELIDEAAPAPQPSFVDELVEVEERRHRAYAATMLAWQMHWQSFGGQVPSPPPARRSGHSRGGGRHETVPESGQRRSPKSQSATAKPIRLAVTGMPGLRGTVASPIPGSVSGAQDFPTIRAALKPFVGQNDPIAVYAKVAALSIPSDEDERRRRDGGGGAAVGRRTHLPASRNLRDIQALAARASVGAGAQPAVFKVISTASTHGSAGALLQYLGTRPGEDGKKHDVEVFTSEGYRLENSEDRRALLDEWRKDFREPFQTTNFIEVNIELGVKPEIDDLHDALTATFEDRPFVYVRDGSGVKVYAYSGMKAAPLAKALQKVNDESGRGGVLQRADAALTDRFAASGMAGKAEVVAAVSTERGGQYFLQKFVRANTRVVTSDGTELSAAVRPDKAADALYASWKTEFKTVEPRNVYHVLFSARAGTEAGALMRAVENVLAENVPDHKWALAHHPETGHVHVHAMILARSEDGRQLHFSKSDLYEWRAFFAEKAREQGIAMVATSRTDFAATRPFNARQAAAYERSRKDTRYTIGSDIAERVEAKRRTAFDPRAIAMNGTAIVAGWRASAVAADMALPATGAHLGAAAFSSAVSVLMESERYGTIRQVPVLRQERKSDLVASLDKQIQEIMSMSLTPLEMRRKIATVDKAYQRLEELMPTEADKKDVSEIREEMSGLLNERLNDIRVQYAADTAAGSSNREESRSLGEKAEQVKTQDHANEQASRQPDKQAGPARVKNEQSKKANEQAARAERQNRDTQRSLDDDMER